VRKVPVRALAVGQLEYELYSHGKSFTSITVEHAFDLLQVFADFFARLERPRQYPFS
jgi:hypothetical protein